MTEKDVCEQFLQGVKDAKMELPYIRNRITALRQRCRNARAEDPNAVEAYRRSLREEENRMLQLEKKLLEAEKKVERFIERIPDAESRSILRFRYIEGLPWDEVGERIYRSRSRVYAYYKDVTAPLVYKAWEEYEKTDDKHQQKIPGHSDPHSV